MENNLCKLLLFGVSLFLWQNSFAQEQKYVTEQYFISQKQCVVYAYALEDSLRSRGLYGGQKTTYRGKGEIEKMKKKVYIGGVDFTKDCTFIIELLGDRLPKDENPYEFQGSFGIIEIGFLTEEKAKEVYEKAKIMSKKYAMNIPILEPPFRCVSVGKSVIFVYSINVNMDKFRDMAVSFKLGNAKNK